MKKHLNFSLSYNMCSSEYLIKSKPLRLDMDWTQVLTLLGIFAVVLTPVFWLILHFRNPIPSPPVKISPERKTELEEIFGM
jgi:hypothetical protein